MSYSRLTQRLVVALSSLPLLLSAILPARAGHPTNAPTSMRKVVVVPQPWCGPRGQVVVDWPPVTGESRSLRGGSISTLLRLGEDEQQIPFAQLGYSQYPSGRTLNIGFGHRWWFPSSATRWGVNLFYDYQLKEHHRLGVGAEMQHDFIKWSVNSYLPLSHRRALENTLVDFIKPAWGVDGYMEAYLPQHPWLGFRAGGEYYAGDAGLVREPQGFKSVQYPTAMLGVNYLPVPLLKISYDYVFGKQQRDAHRVNLQLTYRFNHSLNAQLQPDQVGLWRTAQGSQLDLVSRRYRMVLNRTTRTVTNKPVENKPVENKPVENKPVEKIRTPEQEIKCHREFISYLCKNDATDKAVVKDINDFIISIDKELDSFTVERMRFVFEHMYDNLNITDKWHQFNQSNH